MADQVIHSQRHPQNLKFPRPSSVSDSRIILVFYKLGGLDPVRSFLRPASAVNQTHTPGPTNQGKINDRTQSFSNSPVSFSFALISVSFCLVPFLFPKLSSHIPACTTLPSFHHVALRRFPRCRRVGSSPTYLIQPPFEPLDPSVCHMPGFPRPSLQVRPMRPLRL